MKNILAMLAADVSGSMSGEKLSDAKQALIDFTEELPPNGAIGIVRFGGLRARTVQTPTTRRNKVVAAVENLEALGGTPLHAGLKLSFQEIRRVSEESEMRHALTTQDKSRRGKSSNKTIVLSTDGKPTIGPKERGIVKLSEKIKSRGVKLVTVAIGDDADADLLREIASGTENFHSAVFSGQLPDLYREIASGLVIKED
ncbi:VWA domain-containing protein [Candidatus Bipolaricaulota bacterium]|nr:VWA domain-containing protein [Candidatus Bipolaricaulota bacterium]